MCHQSACDKRKLSSVTTRKSFTLNINAQQHKSTCYEAVILLVLPSPRTQIEKTHDITKCMLAYSNGKHFRSETWSSVFIGDQVLKNEEYRHSKRSSNSSTGKLLTYTNVHLKPQMWVWWLWPTADMTRDQLEGVPHKYSYTKSSECYIVGLLAGQRHRRLDRD